MTQPYSPPHIATPLPLPPNPPTDLTAQQLELLTQLPPFSQLSLFPVLTFYRSSTPRRSGGRRPEPLAFYNMGDLWSTGRVDISADLAGLRRALNQCWQEYQADAFRSIEEQDAMPPAPVEHRTDWLIRASLTAHPEDARLRQCVSEVAKTLTSSETAFTTLGFDPSPLARDLLESLQNGRSAALRLFQDLGENKPSFYLLQANPELIDALAELAQTQVTAARWYAAHCNRVKGKPGGSHAPTAQDLLDAGRKLFFQDLTLNSPAEKDHQGEWNYFRQLPPNLVNRRRRPLDYRRLRQMLDGQIPVSLELAAVILDGTTPPKPGKGPLFWHQVGYAVPHVGPRSQPDPPRSLIRWCQWLDQKASQIGRASDRDRRSRLTALLSPLELFLTPVRREKLEARCWRALQVRAWQILTKGARTDPEKLDQALRDLYQPHGKIANSRNGRYSAAWDYAHDWYAQLQQEIQGFLTNPEPPPALNRLLDQIPPPREIIHPDQSQETLLAPPGANPNAVQSESIRLMRQADGQISLTAGQRIWQAADGESAHFKCKLTPPLLPETNRSRLPARPPLGTESSVINSQVTSVLHHWVLGQKFLTRRWGTDLVRYALNDQPPLPLLPEAANYHAATFYQILQDNADPEILAMLRQLQIPEASRQLPVYNCLAANRTAFQPLLETNPAAAAWVALRVSQADAYFYEDYDPATASHTLRRWRCLKAKHPGQVIARVRQEFSKAGGKHWKAFSARPADFPGTVLSWMQPVHEDSHAQMQRVFQFSDALAAANLSWTDLRDRPSARSALNAALSHSQGAYLGRLLARQLQADQTLSPEERTDADLDRLQEVYNVLDYFSQANPIRPGQPAPASRNRSKTWKGLVKKAVAWHREHARVAAEKQTRKALQLQQGRLKYWNSLVDDYKYQPNGWTAQAITDEASLYLESQTMNNCVGRDHYLEECWQGRSRIFHLSSPDRAEELTLELAGLPDQPETFAQRQLAGMTNARASYQGQAAAAALAAQYRVAALRQFGQSHQAWLAAPPADRFPADADPAA